jgi:hypothetical protein
MSGTVALGKLLFGARRPGTRTAGGAAATSLDTIWYGQSNQLGHFGESSSPPSAADGTEVWDNDADAWITPVGNGIREFLNAVAAATNLPCRAISGGVSGEAIARFQKGNGSGHYEAMMAEVVASGITPSYIIWHQGEGDANSASPSAATYRAALDDIHGDITADLGLTRAQCPMIVSGLATVTDGAFVFSDQSWATIQSTLATINDYYPHIHFSHSNLDATLTDGVHWNGASYGRSGKWYAQTVKVLEGLASPYPAWFATASAIVDATTTDVTVVHSMGTDFTPTTGITGFEISGNNGADWEAPSAAVRQSATAIRLTHSDFGTAADRLIRYGYGKTPTVSAPVVDNGTLASRLVYTATNVTAEGSGLPVATYRNRVPINDGDANQAATGVDLGASTASEDLMVILGLSAFDSGAISTVTLTPDGGSPISATMVSNTLAAKIARVLVPQGTTGIDNCTVDITYSANPFSNTMVTYWTVPAGNLSSQTPVDVDTVSVNSNTVATVDISTSADGFWIAVGYVTNFASTTFTGDTTPAERLDESFNGVNHIAADASGTPNATNTETVTATTSGSANIRLVVASWR